jgi:hypothetical protein
MSEMGRPPMFQKFYRGLINRASCYYCGGRFTVIPSGLCLRCGLKNKIDPNGTLLVHNRKGFVKVKIKKIYCKYCKEITMHIVTLKGYICTKCNKKF